MQTTLKKAVESAGDPEAGLGWVHAQRAMSMVKAARFIVLATAIERNIPSYFWLSTCGAANLELSAFGDCDSCFLGFHKKRKQTNSKKISENTREKDGMAVLQVLQVHRGHKANTFSLLNSDRRSGPQISLSKLPVPAVGCCLDFKLCPQSR